MNARVELSVPAHALPQRSPRELLIMARRGLEEAAATEADSLIRSAHDWIRVVEVSLGLNVAPSAVGGEPSGDSSKGSSASGSSVGGKPKAPSKGSDLQVVLREDGESR